MTQKLLILPEAIEDLAEGRRWYEERAVGLGDRFLFQAEDCIRRIQLFPDLYEQVYKTYRRAIVRRFPFVVFYEHSTDGIINCAVFHTAQDPKNWRKRLR
jgi:plasmid stabilization system protein ParE